MLYQGRQESVGQKISEVSFVAFTISHVGHCSFLESIEHDFIKAMQIQTGNWVLIWLSWQSIRVMIQKLWVPTPLGAIFDGIYFDLCNFRSFRLSDRNDLSWKTQITRQHFAQRVTTQVIFKHLSYCSANEPFPRLLKIDRSMFMAVAELFSTCK